MPQADNILEGTHKASTLLQSATTPAGILASTEDTANYHRIWARDGIVCGLAGLLANNEILIAGLKATLTTLAKHQGPEGQIPSNVKFDSRNKTREVSYGGLVGRVDPTLWFIIGVCHYVNQLGDSSFEKEMETPLRRCLSLLKAWEFNGKGLLYIPQGGDWADEFILSGYVLYDQLLYVWALRCFAKIYADKDVQNRSVELSSLISFNYWPQTSLQHREQLRHPQAYKKFLDDNQEAQYWLPTLNPGGYNDLFDTLSNALSVILNIGKKNQLNQTIEFGRKLGQNFSYNLLPSFWPPIDETHKQWTQLCNSYSHKFRNYPYQYQNGGVWPIINAWWGVALVQAGSLDMANQVLQGIIQLNKLDMDGDNGWGFYEYVHAKTGLPGGTRHFSWSAAGILLLDAALHNKTLYYG